MRYDADADADAARPWSWWISKKYWRQSIFTFVLYAANANVVAQAQANVTIEVRV